MLLPYTVFLLPTHNQGLLVPKPNPVVNLVKYFLCKPKKKKKQRMIIGENDKKSASLLGARNNSISHNTVLPPDLCCYALHTGLYFKRPNKILVI